METLADQFIDLACLCYDDPHFDHRSFHRRAHEMLKDNPGLASSNIWSAAAAGNAPAVRSFLDENPGLVDHPGPNGWVPLLCACYSRVQPVEPAHSTFEVAKLLLDRGADPNAYTLKHNDPPGSKHARRFTALSGLFGGGSTGFANQPPHPRWRELADLLLERGADPADPQALHINQDASLAILLRYGLKPDARIETEEHVVTLMGRALCEAAHRGRAGNVRLLLEHYARADETLDGKTPWQHAMEHGHLEIARMLEAAGAPAAKQSEVERFVTLCMAGDEPGARAMLARAPDLPERTPQGLVMRAVGTGRKEAVNLVLDLGFHPDWMEDCAALHSAAGEGNEEMVRLLINRGASLTLREPWYDGTAIEWAEFFDHTRLRDMLLNEGAICLFDALDHNRLDRVPEILARDPAALNRPFAECISRQPKPEDQQTPLARMVDRGRTEAVRVLLDHGADTSARHFDGRSLLQLAADKGFAEIANLLK
jgi:ankyrin repeat protein